jgi:hypothetical protein
LRFRDSQFLEIACSTDDCSHKIFGGKFKGVSLLPPLLQGSDLTWKIFGQRKVLEERERISLFIYYAFQP